MKKILLATALVLTMGFGAKAQYGNMDAYIANWGDSERSFEETFSLAFPTSHGLVENGTAPLGSGLFILGALGAGYAVARRKRK